MKDEEISNEFKKYLETYICSKYYSNEYQYLCDNAKVNIENLYGILPDVLSTEENGTENDSFFLNTYYRLVQNVSKFAVSKINFLDKLQKYYNISKILCAIIIGLFIVLTIFRINFIIPRLIGISLSIVILNLIVISLCDFFVKYYFISHIGFFDMLYLLNHSGFNIDFNRTIVSSIGDAVEINKDIIVKICNNIIPKYQGKHVTNDEAFVLFIILDTLISISFNSNKKSLLYQQGLKYIEQIYVYNQDSDYLKYLLGIYYLRSGKNIESLDILQKVKSNSIYYLNSRILHNYINYIGKL